MSYQAQYLVTGAAGFVGSHLTRALVHAGMPVRAIDALLTTKSWWRLDDLADSVERVTCDLLDSDRLDSVLSGADFVFHAAGVAEPENTYHRLAQSYHQNAAADVQFLEAALHCDVQKIVLSSTCAVYSQQPTLNDARDRLPASNLTGLAKRITEKTARYCASHFGLNVVALRYSEVYGESQSPDPWLAPIAAIASAAAQGVVPLVAGDSQVRRDFVHVDDVVRANLLAMAAATNSGTAFDIGCGYSVSLSEVVARLNPPVTAQRFRQARSHHPSPPQPELNTARIQLGYMPSVSLEEGLMRTAAWFRDRDDFIA